MKESPRFFFWTEKDMSCGYTLQTRSEVDIIPMSGAVRKSVHPSTACKDISCVDHSCTFVRTSCHFAQWFEVTLCHEGLKALPVSVFILPFISLFPFPLAQETKPCIVTPVCLYFCKLNKTCYLSCTCKLRLDVPK